ncbi:replication initiation protein RepC [Rhizobium sp. KVB221]|uniref:Replication initiation protein RepC n=1 Tax=Rhizobium setariae TaxID=2801340 RepID=A0A937CRW2_9HYPH|nr:plasmid replication protein RepC [Rhizobium setariae]MBL0375367.1 replication initiation protein RepC [Rhizobium setariae]
MQSGTVTTPFGRRPMTLAMVASQSIEVDKNKTIDKWMLYRALCEARTRLGVTDRALALLNALLTFYPKAELSAEHLLIVFPSNAQLSARAHGMAEPTIRRHLAILVDAGLIARKDSANGKRFARRDGEGGIDDAFGFSLAPLLARAEEIEMLAADAAAERLVFQRLRERLTICRRDVAKLIAAAIAEGAAGDWEAHHVHYRAIVDAVPRTPTAMQVASSLDEMELLREGIVNALEMQMKTQNHNGNPLQSERHIQNSNTESYSESEPRFEKKQDATLENHTTGRRMAEGSNMQRQSLKSEAQASGPSDIRAFPLGFVLQACPQIVDYGPGGAIASWRDMMSAAVVVRSMLGVSPSAYQDACEVMGPENAATVIACILERGGHINSAGGYLRDLTRRAERDEFGLGPMLMALSRTNAGVRRAAS